MRVLFLSLVLSTLAACGSTGEQVEPEPVQAVAPEWPAPIGEVTLAKPRNVGEVERLDVGIVILDPGIPEDASTHSELDIFPKIREVEARYLPVVLRDTLVATETWGVVRVLPDVEEASELLLTGTILHSDGLRLVLAVRAVDATGRVWLDQIYLDEASENDYPVRGVDPYADLYHAIANDLLAVRRGMDQKELLGIRQVALLRYAAGLSPEAFGGYLLVDPDGRYRVARLPSQGDPMMGRVDRIRNQEHLFIDTVDEQYVDLQQTMAPTYDLWRQYGREQALYREEYQERVANRERQGQRGSFYAMQRAYDAYKWTKIQAQDLDELAVGFNNEVAPTVMQASGRVFRLSGTLDTQYAEWREILRKIFALETGLPPAGG